MKVYLKIPKTSRFGCPHVTIDNRPVKLKVKGGDYLGCVETEKSNVELCMTRLYELEGKCWFLMSMLFFFISILGIFDVRREKRFNSFEYKATLVLHGDAHLQFKPYEFKENERALAIANDCEVYEHTNVYTVKNFLKKRRRILILTKLLVWLALIAAVIVIVVQLF